MSKGFHSNADPDPASENNADPCVSGYATLIRKLDLLVRGPQVQYQPGWVERSGTQGAFLLAHILSIVSLHTCKLELGFFPFFPFTFTLIDCQKFN